MCPVTIDYATLGVPVSGLAGKECFFRFGAVDFLGDVFVLEDYLDDGTHYGEGVVSVEILVGNDGNRGVQVVEKTLI